MNLHAGELSFENYKKLGLPDLERFYALRIIPHLNTTMEAACALLESKPGEKGTAEQYVVVCSLARQFMKEYNEHSSKQLIMFEAQRTKQTDHVNIDVPKLLESHQQMCRILDQINELSEKGINSQAYSPMQKLGYAHINNLRQDVSRLFFLEEEYLFPRLHLLNRHKGKSASL